MSKFGALDNQVVGYHSDAEWKKRLEAQGFLCFYCASPICEGSADPNLEAVKDHLFAASRGGVDFIWNIVAACARCNRLKGVMLPGEFLKRLFPFAQLEDGMADKSTAIPLFKERDRFGQMVTGHVAVSQPIASVVRYLDVKCAMERDDAWYERRRALLRNQVLEIQRLSLEHAGQMVLPIFWESGEKKLTTHEPMARRQFA